MADFRQWSRLDWNRLILPSRASATNASTRRRCRDAIPESSARVESSPTSDSGISPPYRPTRIRFPPLRSAPRARPAVGGADEIDRAVYHPAGNLFEFARSIGITAVYNRGGACCDGRSNFTASTSIATTRSWPIARSMEMADSPSPPTPITATHSSGGIGLSFETAE